MLLILAVRRQLTSDGASTRSSRSSFNHVDTVGSDLECRLDTRTCIYCIALKFRGT